MELWYCSTLSGGDPYEHPCHGDVYVVLRMKGNLTSIIVIETFKGYAHLARSFCGLNEVAQ
jgi:hypothetical protein